MGLETKQLRDEIFVQLTKQMTHNPNPYVTQPYMPTFSATSNSNRVEEQQRKCPQHVSLCCYTHTTYLQDKPDEGLGAHVSAASDLPAIQPLL
jgi:hypothetical protein